MYYKTMSETKQQDPSTFIDYLKAEDRREEHDNLGNTWLHRYSRVNRDDQGNRIPTDRIVEALILYGVDVTAVNTAGDTALHLAVQNNINICRLLIQNGANVNAVNNKGKTPLHCAAQHDGNVESICNLLINNNADQTIRDKNGKLPIFYTCDDNIASILEGADNELTDDIRTVVRKGSSVLFRKLVDRGMSISDQATQTGYTLLHEAVLSDAPVNKKVDICNRLLALQHIVDNNNCIPLALTFQDAIANLFVNIDTTVATPETVFKAAAYVSINIIRRQLELQPDIINRWNGNRETLLYIALDKYSTSRPESIALVKLLIEKGANVDDEMVQTLLLIRTTPRDAVSQIQEQKRQREVLLKTQKGIQEEREKRIEAFKRRCNKRKRQSGVISSNSLDHYRKLSVPVKLRF